MAEQKMFKKLGLKFVELNLHYIDDFGVLRFITGLSKMQSQCRLRGMFGADEKR